MGDVYMLNGKILSGLPNHAKDIEFDNTGTTLSSTNTEDAIKEVNSNLSAHDFGTAISLNSYTSFGSAYECPCDGYVKMNLSSTTPLAAVVYVNNNPMLSSINDSNYTIMSLFVRKGMKVHVANVAPQASMSFIPIE